VAYLDPIDFDTPDFADLYDELPLWSAPFALWILERVPLGSEKVFLDIGAGTGFLSIELAERCGASSQVIAVDPWSSAMGRLRRKVHQRQLKNIRLLEQDAASLDLPDESVDVVVSNLGINNFDDPRSVLQVCWRSAKPGATLLLTTNLIGHMSEFYEIYRSVLLQSGQDDRVSKLDRRINHRATPATLKQLLEETGFEVAEVVLDSFKLRFATGTAFLRHHFIRLGFLQAWVELATPGEIDATFVALEEALNAEATARGELTLTVPTAGVVARKPASKPNKSAA
jgi:arsenite methyltransferase